MFKNGDKVLIKATVEKVAEMTVRDEKALMILHEFIESHDIDCVEDVYQRDSVNEECVDFVAELVEAIVLG